MLSIFRTWHDQCLAFAVVIWPCLSYEARYVLYPDLEVKDRGRQEFDKMLYDAGANVRDFAVGEAVFPRNSLSRYRHKAGVIFRHTGPVSYNVQVGNGVEHRHALQLRRRRSIIDHLSEEKVIDCNI